MDPKNSKTAEAHLLSLRQYWKYLHARGHVMGDEKGGVLVGQQLPNNGKRAGRGSRDTERPFTRGEVQALLFRPFPAEMDQTHRAQLHDALRTAPA